MTIDLPITYFDTKNCSFVYESTRGFSQETCVHVSYTTFCYSDQRETYVERHFFYLLYPNLHKCQLVNQLDQWAYHKFRIFPLNYWYSLWSTIGQ